MIDKGNVALALLLTAWLLSLPKGRCPPPSFVLQCDC